MKNQEMDKKRLDKLLGRDEHSLLETDKIYGAGKENREH
jgi:hypothetical protein